MSNDTPNTDNQGARGAIGTNSPMGGQSAAQQVGIDRSETKAQLLIQGLNTLQGRAIDIRERLVNANDRISGPVPTACADGNPEKMHDNGLVNTLDRQLTDLSDTMDNIENQLRRLEEFA